MCLRRLHLHLHLHPHPPRSFPASLLISETGEAVTSERIQGAADWMTRI